MNPWLLAAGLVGLVCAAGHAFAGAETFYRPIQARLTDPTLSAVFTAMWHLITIHFLLSALALILCGLAGPSAIAVWLVAAQFAGYAVLYLIISLRLGGPGKLFQWGPFSGLAILAAIGAFVGS